MHDLALTHEMARLALQLGMLLLAAHGLGRLARRANLTSLIGEIAAGMILGPFALGAIPVPGFPEGLFPIADPAFPVSQLLFGFATIGAIVHIFLAGLESDPGFLARIRTRGIVIALIGAAAGLGAGAFAASALFGTSPFQPAGLFIMAASVSTSIGVQARVLAGRHRLAAPEGSVIVGSSLFHDGFAIILLSAAVGLAGTGIGFERLTASAGGSDLGPMLSEGFEQTRHLTAPLVTAFATWIAAYAILLYAARGTTRFAMRLFSRDTLSMLSLAAALLVSGLFEAMGIAAVAGAYGVGLALSRTELSTSFEQRVKPLAGFFIPILYAVLGMFVDLRIALTPSVLFPALAFAFISGAAKTVGAMIPARLGGFTWFGSLLTGLGTVPRGEVGVVIAGIGVATGVLPLSALNTLTLMIVFSTLVATPLFGRLLLFTRPRTTAREGLHQSTVRSVTFPNDEIAELVTGAILRAVEKDGFLIHRMEIDGAIYSLRDRARAFTLRRSRAEIQLSGNSTDAEFLNTILYEAIIHVNQRIRTLTTIEVPSELRRETGESTETADDAEHGSQPRKRLDTQATHAGGRRKTEDLVRFLNPCAVALPVTGRTSEQAIEELVHRLSECGKLRDTDTVLEDVIRRERSLGTGLDREVALPHARSNGVDRIAVAVGIAPQGIDFQALDGTKSRIIVLVVSPRERTGPHLQLIAALTSRLKTPTVRAALLAAESAGEVIEALR